MISPGIILGALFQNLLSQQQHWLWHMHLMKESEVSECCQ